MYSVYINGDLVLDGGTLEQVQQELKTCYDSCMEDEKYNRERWPEDYGPGDLSAEEATRDWMREFVVVLRDVTLEFEF